MTSSIQAHDATGSESGLLPVPTGMSRGKTASAMIYLVEELGDARMRCDQVLRYIEKAVKLVEKSSHRDHFFEVAGDVLRGLPESAFKLQKALEAVALAANRIDYEEIKQDLRPEKVEELERVLKDVRVRQVQRRSLPMVNPANVAEQLKALAKKARDDGRLDTVALGALISSLELGAPPRTASVDRGASQLEAMAHALENPPKGEVPSRRRLAHVLRKTYGEHIRLSSELSREAGYRRAPEVLFTRMKDAVDKLLVARVAIRQVHEDLSGVRQDASGLMFTNNYESPEIAKVDKELYELDHSIGSAFRNVEHLERVMRKTMLKMASAEDAKRSRFEEGKPADPTKNMDPEDAKAWKDNTDEYGDKFKKEAAKPSETALLEINTAIYGLKQLGRGAGNPKRIFFSIVSSLSKAAAHLGQEDRISAALDRAALIINQTFSAADMREYSDAKSVMATEDAKRSRFEEGKPADPTKNMDPEDAKAWKDNTDEYGDKFKKEGGLEGNLPFLDRLVNTVEESAKQLKHSVDLVKRDAAKYAPQLDNIQTQVNTLSGMLRIVQRRVFDVKTATARTGGGQMLPAPPPNVVDEIMSWHGGQGSHLYSVGSRWLSDQRVDADDAEAAYDELERRGADHEALADFEDHLMEHGVTPDAVRERVEKMQERERKEMEKLLKAKGFDPKDAKKLQAEGIGPEELQVRLRVAPGAMGSLEYTHNLKRKTKKAGDAAFWKSV